MLQIRNILYPTDFSACANVAFPHALRIARLHDATIHMLHVAPAVGPNPIPELSGMEAETDLTPIEQDLRDQAEQQMDALVSAHKAGDVTIKRIHAQHLAPGPILLKYAEAKEIDLIVMGSHGRTGMRRLLVGSVAEEMIRRASCPVLIVREQEGPATTSRFVGGLMVPYDFSGHAEHALRYALELAALYDTTVDVVHVIDPGTHLDEYAMEVAEHGKVLEKLKGEARKSLEEINAASHERPIDVAYHVLTGFPPREIVEFARQKGSGMIVLSSHGRTGKKSILIGSVAEHVVRHAPCPVFIARPLGKSLVPRAGKTHTSEDASARAERAA